MVSAPTPSAPRIVTWRAFMEAHERVLARIRKALAPFDLSVSEFDVLVNLSPGERCRHTELASRVVLSRTALTRLVDRLSDRGMVARAPDDSDGRGRCISLTTEGARLRRAALSANAAAVRRSFENLTDRDIEELRELVGAMAPPV